MPTIFDTPPQAVQTNLDGLVAALDTEIPAKANDNLLIATWNIRSFASLTRKWFHDLTIALNVTCKGYSFSF